MPASAVTRHHNLPAHRVHLFGRKRDLAIARTELLATEGRLLTMTGTGGCGKTHLAGERTVSAVAALRVDFGPGFQNPIADMASVRLVPGHALQFE